MLSRTDLVAISGLMEIFGLVMALWASGLLAVGG